MTLNLVISLLAIIGFIRELVYIHLPSSKLSKHRYQLEFLFTVGKDWHIYVASDVVRPLEEITIMPDNEKCSLIDDSFDSSSICKIVDSV